MPGRPAFDAATAYRQATAALAERDPVLRRLIGEAGPPDVSPPTESHLAALVRAIVYQQLAGAAASAIHGRLIAALDDQVEPVRLVALSDEVLRAAGLSANKMSSLRDLSAKVLDGTVVLDPRRLSRESDDEVT